MKKKYIFLGILVLAFAGFYYFTPSIETIVKRVVHKYGSEVTGTDVRLDGFDISLTKGEGKIKKITVANPKGYKSPYLLSLDGISIKINLKSLTTDTIIIENVIVDKPVIAYEMLSLTQNNIKQIQHNVNNYAAPKASDTPAEKQKKKETAQEAKTGKKVIIKSLSINGGEIQAVTTVAGQTNNINVVLPTIQMTNIGGAKNGDSIPVMISKVLNQILSTASATAVSNNLSNLKDVANENLNNVVGGVKDRVKSLGIFKK